MSSHPQESAYTMSLEIPVSQDQLTRQERLIIWMRRNGKTGTTLATYAGVQRPSACRWLRVDELPWPNVQIMRDFGIPEELLPKATGKYDFPASPDEHAPTASA